MHYLPKRALIAIACAAAAAAAAGPSPRALAQTKLPDSLTVKPLLIDRVMATVEDHAILRSDVDALYRQYLAQSQRTSLPPDEEAKLRNDILESLVSDQLMALEAERKGIKIEDRELEAAIDRQIERNKLDLGGEDGFNKALAAEGLTLETLKAQYRERMQSSMLVDRLMDKEIRPKIEVTDRDVREYYRSHESELEKRPATVTVSHILIAPQPSDSVRAAALAKITAIEKRIRNGEDFATLATQYSDCPSAKYGGNLGLIRLSDLNNPAFEEAARTLTVGQVSHPVLTEFGYHLIKLDAVEGDQVRVRHILVNVQPTPADLERAAKLAEKVRSEIVAGADFAAMARRYSADYSAKDTTAITGEIALSDFPAEIADLIKGVPAGDVAPVIKDAKGFRILKIMSWNAERAFTYDEAKDYLRQLVGQQQMRDRLAAYVTELKKHYAVQIKGE